MKRFLLHATALLVSGSLSGQIITGPSLISDKSEFIGHTSYIPWNSNPLLIEAGPESFYWIGGSDNDNVAHPQLSDLYSDSDYIFFTKYDENGNPGPANYIQGTYEMIGAFSFKGGLTVAGRTYMDVVANGNPVPINNASQQEFIASYNDLCQFRKIIPIWDLGPSEYPYSEAQMDKRDGSVYIAGTSYTPLNLDGYGIIGEGMENFLYVIKYSYDLDRKWVYVAGFDTFSGEYGYIYNIVITPDANNNVIITGTAEGDRNLVFGRDTLPTYDHNYSLFALKLDGNGKQVWVKEGTAEGYNYSGASAIFKGLAMRNGDVILAGVTATGHFRLGDSEFKFENGEFYSNQFAFRIDPDGRTRWETSFQNMGQAYGEGKKGTEEKDGVKGSESEEFSSEIYYDVIKWGEEVLYMTGTYLSDSFQVAGKLLDKKFNTGIFVAAMEVGTDACEQVWGYGLSSDWVSIYGFDNDRTGNVSIMGLTTANQDFDLLQTETISGTNVFHLGLDYNGEPLWQNNAYLQGLGSGIYGVDLEVLSGGNVFSSISLNETDYMVLGGNQFIADYSYASWLVNLVCGSELGGKVTTKFESTDPALPVYPGYVKAYKSAIRGAYPTVDSVWLDEAGNYLFTGLYPGRYTLQVVVDTTNYAKAWSTYLGNAVAWRDAEFIDVKTDTKAATVVNITLFQNNQVSTGFGKGFMSGRVSYADESLLKGTLGDPVTKTSVILIKKASAKKSALGDGDVVVAIVETDEDLGEYKFTGVPDGEYILIVDIVGLPMLNFYEVVIEGEMIVSGLDFTVSGEGIDISGPVDVKSIEMEQFMMFPNPGDGNIYMGFPESSDYLIRVYTTDGRLVKSENLVSVSGLRKLDISDNKDGIYLISIDGENLSARLKYLKR